MTENDERERERWETYLAECKRLESAWVEVMEHSREISRMSRWLCVGSVILAVVAVVRLITG